MGLGTNLVAQTRSVGDLAISAKLSCSIGGARPASPPFLGGGFGRRPFGRDLGTDWDPTLVVAAGTGVRLTLQLGLLAEMRVRGVEWRFAGSTAEWAVGLAWRIPSF